VATGNTGPDYPSGVLQLLPLEAAAFLFLDG
jgi:hypothetical protein